MSVADIKAILDAYADAIEAKDKAAVSWPDYIEHQRVLAAYEELCRKRDAWLAPYAEVISALESEIKDKALALGETVRGDHYIAIFKRGRVSWDQKLLDGYAVAHPEILPFRHVGQPGVMIMFNGSHKDE